MGSQRRLGRSGVLPPEVTSFVGRRADVLAVTRALAESRLVTVIGVGGVGKTRVAVNVARQMRRQFRDGVWVIELSNLSDPALLPHEILAGLGVSDPSSRERNAVLHDYLSSRSLLLVLDGSEAVTEAVAAATIECLGASPGVSILVTSRERLRAAGERVIALAPLPIPDVDDDAGAKPSAWPSIALFLDRAKAAVPGLDLGPADDVAVAKVCRRLEGIPLAMELAANQLQVMSIHDLLDRLSDRFDLLAEGTRGVPARHQTLRATLDWSFDLCTPAEQTVWARAAVFAGSFTLAQAEIVCGGDGLPRHAVLGCVRGLVEKSVLVRAEQGSKVRFRLPDTMAEYGLSVLRARDEEARTRLAHVRALISFVEEVNTRWFGPDEEVWLSRLRAERANLRSAFDFSVGPLGDPEAGLSLASASWFYWLAGGHLPEGRYWLDRVLSRAPRPSRERAHALWACAYVAALQGDHLHAEALAIESSALARHFEDSRAQAYATHMLGLGVVLMGDAGRGSMLLRSAVLLYRDVSVVDGLAALLHLHVGINHLFRGDLDQAREVFAACDELCANRGDRWIRSYARAFSGLVAFLRGTPDEARAAMSDALRIAREIQDSVAMAVALDLLGWVAADEHRADDAVLLLGAATHVWEELGEPMFGAESLATHRRRAHEQVRAALGDESFSVGFERGQGLGLAPAIRLALGEAPPHKAARRSGHEVTGVGGIAADISPREWEVATLLRDGLSNKEIAATLVISLRTAETHVQNLLQKLGFSSRTQVAVWASEQPDYRSGR